MRSFSALDLLGAQRWKTALFTTYSLSLAYFEAVVLGAMAHGVDRTVLLSDIVGLRAALSEYGAHLAGRTYQVEPVAVARGHCLHAKLTALTTDDDAHLIVGSGNLTARGYGGNLECAEHLHPSFAADAFDDVAAFLDALADSETARHAAGEICGSVASDLRRVSSGRPRTGAIRVVSSLDGAIVDRLAGFAEELGGARRLTIASPFYDRAGGSAVDGLCRALGLDHLYIHAHPDTAASATGLSWPIRTETPIHAVTVEPLAEDNRPLHAKIFEVVCGRGRLIMSGSANATMAALEHGRNIELSVVRLLREPSQGWRLLPSDPLEVSQAEGDTEEAEAEVDILRAEMSGGVLNGRVLTGFTAGAAKVFDLTLSGPNRIATTQVTDDGYFEASVRSLERDGWQSRRLVIRLVSTASGRIAEGLVHFPDIGAISRRAGPIAARLLAFIAGNETPSDVAALMTWFYDHPEHLKSRIGGGGRGAVGEKTDNLASVAGLTMSQPIVADSAEGDFQEDAGWRHFMNQLWAALSLPGESIRRRADDDDALEEEDDQGASTSRPPYPDADLVDVTARFDLTFDKLLGEDHGRRDVGAAMLITQYVCERLDLPRERADHYLGRLLKAMIGADIPDADKPAMVAAVLVWAASQQTDDDSGRLRSARRRLLLLGTSIYGDPPSIELARGFMKILAPDFDVAALWAGIQGVRTSHEEVAAYWQSSPGAVQESDFPVLAKLPVWNELATANAADRARMHYLPSLSSTCPQHYRVIPNAQAKQLESHGVAKAANCCNAFLLLGEVV